MRAKIDDHLHVGNIIKARRESVRMSKTALGNELGTSSQNVTSLEGRQSIDFKLAMRINQILQFDIFSYFQTPDQKDQAVTILEKKLLDIQDKYIKLLEEKTSDQFN